jgi:Icc-related predicted phosphoesterase
MKLLIFSDIHGDWNALERLMDTEADYYFAAGDLCDWGRGIERLGPIMQKRAERMYVIPGNHESEQYIAQFCQQNGFHNFHGQTIELNGFTVAGLGYSNPTPFNTPGEYTEEELAARLSKFAGLDPLVLICHAPPKCTKLDQAGKDHFGSAGFYRTQSTGVLLLRSHPRGSGSARQHRQDGMLERRQARPNIGTGRLGKMKRHDI